MITEQQQREIWDKLLLDIETRTEQLRQLKRFEPKWLVIQSLTAGAALFAAGSAFTAVMLHWK